MDPTKKLVVYESTMCCVTSKTERHRLTGHASADIIVMQYGNSTRATNFALKLSRHSKKTISEKTSNRQSWCKTAFHKHEHALFRFCGNCPHNSKFDARHTCHADFGQPRTFLMMSAISQQNDGTVVFLPLLS